MEKFCPGLNFSPVDGIEKKSRLHEKIQSGLKMKSEVKPNRNFVVHTVVLTIRIFSRVSFIFSALAEMFLCHYMGFFSPVTLAEKFIPGCNYSWNREPLLVKYFIK